MIRRLSAAERDEVRRHLRSLDERDRYHRSLWAADAAAIAA